MRSLSMFECEHVAGAQTEPTATELKAGKELLSVICIGFCGGTLIGGVTTNDFVLAVISGFYGSILYPTALVLTGHAIAFTYYTAFPEARLNTSS